MAEFTDFLENELLDHAFRNSAYSQPASVHLALQTTVNSDSTPGTEVTNANGYSRQTTAFNAASGGSIGNTAIEAFTASGGNFGTVVSTSIWDSGTHGGGNQMTFDNDFTDTAVNDGDTLQFAATTGITISLT